jgi:hypothetical protein
MTSSRYAMRPGSSPATIRQNRHPATDTAPWSPARYVTALRRLIVPTGGAAFPMSGGRQCRPASGSADAHSRTDQGRGWKPEVRGSSGRCC